MSAADGGRRPAGATLASEKYADALQVWQHHERSRAAGLPIVSVWLGDPNECELALSCAGREFVWSDGGSLHQVSLDWWRQISDRRDLLSEALSRVAQALGEPESQLCASWKARGVNEREMWLAEIESQNLTDVLALLRSRSDSANKIADYPRALQHLLSWLPRPQCLALSNSAALCDVLQLAIRSPALAVVACLEHKAWATLLPRLDDRRRTLLEQGLIVRYARPEAGPTAMSQGPSVREAYLQARSASVRGAENIRELASRARSLAEQRLYELLQADPVTTGLFELNVKMPFSFGPACAEVDLVCVELRVAVEVDGFHHFREFDAYRRDRRKDVLLQHQGYLVSRHLADDVLNRASEVLRSIRELVERRRRQRRREKVE